MNGTGSNTSDTRPTETRRPDGVQLKLYADGTAWRAVHHAPSGGFPMLQVCRLAGDGRTDAALDIVFDQIDDRLLGGRFDECGAILREVDPSALGPAVAVGFLAITRAADDRLHDARLDLRDRIRCAFRSTMPDTDLEQLLRGL